MSKVILISIDGMRPDGLKQCGNEYVDTLMKESSYTFNAQTVFPSVTLPFHLSMFQSVPPQRHGTLTNDYAIPVRPVNGIFEQIRDSGNKRSAFFYGWEPLRDIATVRTLTASEYFSVYLDNSDAILTGKALDSIKALNHDFVFLYMARTDDEGHTHGWMGAEYLDCINKAISNVKRVIDEVGDEYTVIITADHGGHERSHGTDMPEDMTIPLFLRGREFEPGKELNDVSILDIAPTVAAVMGIEPAREWEGKSLITKS